MATYVLVPGFWFGAWVWDAVAAELRAAGHDVHALTLSGLGERAADATPEVGGETNIADVIGFIESHDLRDVVLVGHSGATVAITGAGDRIPERIKRIVYVDTGPLPDGMPQIDFLQPEGREAQRKEVAERGDGWLIPVPAFDGDVADVLLADLTEEQRAVMRERGTPQPFRVATDAMPRPAVVPPTPKALISSTIPIDAVKAMAEQGHPIFAMMAGPEWTYTMLPTGHWSMLSKPKELAGLLDSLG